MDRTEISITIVTKSKINKDLEQQRVRNEPENSVQHLRYKKTFQKCSRPKLGQRIQLHLGTK